MSSTLIFGSNSIFGKIDRFTSLGMDVKLDKALGLTSDPIESKLGEISQQTAKESEPRAIIWGRVRPIGGNLIHCQEPIKRMVKESVDSGGKGGSSKKTQKVEHVFRTYALGVCEGPITAFARIWRNNKLVYDARGNNWGRANNGVFLKAYRLYLGGWTQMPSPDLEAIWGAGNVPGYRGTAYMVALNEDLTDMSGAVPQWLFEVERAEGYPLTSRPYALEVTEAADSVSAVLTKGHVPPPPYVLSDALGTSGSYISAGDLRNPPSQAVIEAIGSTGSIISAGALRTAPTNSTIEALTTSGSVISSGLLKPAIFHTYPPEGLTTSGSSITTGSLS
jgi:hypothetical protein